MQKKVGQNASMKHIFKLVYMYLLLYWNSERLGFLGMYKGVSVTLIRSIISWGIINCVYEGTKSYF